MKKWYQSTVLRAVLAILTIMAITTGFVSLAIISNCANEYSISDFFSKEEIRYEDTDGFEQILHQAVESTLYQKAIKDNFETEGKYNPDKLVDIMDYSEDSKISGENKSGLAYKVSDLISWYDALGGDFDSYRNNNIIVCKRPDGTYYYYYTGEFQKLLEEGELRLELDEDYSTTSFLEELNNGYYDSAEQFTGNILLKNREGETLYTDCWAFTESLDEISTPDGGKNILDIVNNTEKFNGRLSEIYGNLEYALQDVREQKWNYDDISSSTFEEGNTNFSYYLYNKESDVVYTNNSVYAKEKNADKVIDYIKNQPNLAYVIVEPKLKDFETNIDVSSASWKSYIQSESIVDDNFVYIAAVDMEYPIQDMFYEGIQTFNKFSPYFVASVQLIMVSSIILLICVVWQTIIAGKGESDAEIKLYAFDRWKTELAAGTIIMLWALLTEFTLEIIYTTGYYYEIEGYTYYSGSFFDVTSVVMIGIYGFLTAVLFLVAYLSLVRRIKARTLWKNSLCSIGVKYIWKLCKVIAEFWKNRSLIWKIALILFGFFFIHWLGFGGAGGAIVLALILEVLAAVWILWGTILKERIRTGISKISEGDITHEISTDRMIGTDKEIAENINHIGDGLQNAVNEMMKSERLKTDLITNVSHDIKTPLTSIINYVDLLKRENIDDPKIQGYIKILEEKAQRLKTLTEDVVEASKVSSGNITLEYMDVNLVEMLNQTIGEFTEKFEAKNLKIVTNLPEESAIIHVDNRRMWRVLENIFNNAAKYSMPGTRVYADLKKENNIVHFSLKNISEQPLNIKAEELTERFIRGDISRNTEGSGLGLSIAKNLTELQGGTFELYLDGDLFKVNIEFPGR